MFIKSTKETSAIAGCKRFFETEENEKIPKSKPDFILVDEDIEKNGDSYFE